MTDQHWVVPGSARTPVPGAIRVGDAYPYQPVRVTVVLRRAAPRPGAPAGPDDIEQVERFAHANGLAVTGINAAARSVGLLGTVAQMDTAFDVDLGEYSVDDESYRGREGVIAVPATLAGRVVAVLGLDNRPQSQAHFRVVAPEAEPPA